jgi:hypothetical protein
VKNCPKCSPISFYKLNKKQFTAEKIAQKFGLFKKTPKVNHRPKGENVTNLVTLVGSKLTRTGFFVKQDFLHKMIVCFASNFFFISCYQRFQSRFARWYAYFLTKNPNLGKF